MIRAVTDSDRAGGAKRFRALLQQMEGKLPARRSSDLIMAEIRRLERIGHAPDEFLDKIGD